MDNWLWILAAFYLVNNIYIIHPPALRIWNPVDFFISFICFPLGFVFGEHTTRRYTIWDIAGPTVLSALVLMAIVGLNFAAVWRSSHRSLPRLSLIMFSSASALIWMLFFRCSALPGGGDGIRHYFAPHWDKIAHYEAWFDAGCYVFTTFGVGSGIILTYASLNPVHGPILRNLIISMCASFLYSIISAIAIFSLFGFSAKMYRRKLNGMIHIDPEFLFKYIPMAMDYNLSLPTHFYYCALFFIIILTSTLNIVMRIQNVVVCLREKGINWMSTTANKFWIYAALVCSSYLITIPLISTGGLHWVEITHTGVEGVAQSFLVLVEMIVIGWVFGVKGLNQYHSIMIGSQVHILFPICWKFVSPITAFVLLVLGLIKSNTLSLSRPRKQSLPGWASNCGVYLMVLIVVLIIFVAVWQYVHEELGRTRRIKLLMLVSPEEEVYKILETGDGDRLHRSHYFNMGRLTPAEETKNDEIKSLSMIVSQISRHEAAPNRDTPLSEMEIRYPGLVTFAGADDTSSRKAADYRLQRRKSPPRSEKGLVLHPKPSQMKNLLKKIIQEKN